MGQRGGAGVLWAALLSAALGALIALPWEGTVDTQLTRDASHDAEICRDLETAAYTRTTEYIDSHGTRLQAWVYIPKGLSRCAPLPRLRASRARRCITRVSQRPRPGRRPRAPLARSGGHPATLGPCTTHQPRPTPRPCPLLFSPPPVVLMAHGLGVQKDIGLPPYAERFAKHALAVVLFDYRSAAAVPFLVVVGGGRWE